MATGCPHWTLRLVTFDEEPDVQERNRRPWTCEDCNGSVHFTRFTSVQVIELLLKERLNGGRKKKAS